VLRDPALDTGNKKTVYSFNLARNPILEYTPAILEPKLRPLKPLEQDMIGEIDGAYTEARKGFGTTRRSSPIPNSVPAQRKSKNAANADDEDDIDDEQAFADDEAACSSVPRARGLLARGRGFTLGISGTHRTPGLAIDDPASTSTRGPLEMARPCPPAPDDFERRPATQGVFQ